VRTHRAQRDQAGAWLVAHTGQAVEERDDGTLVAFAPNEAAAVALVEDLGRELDEVEAQRHRLEVTDWSTRWREGLSARRVGRLTIVPSWLPEASEPDPLTIVLDPETAFGSGEHGSTRAALALLGRLLRSGDDVLDLGSGSGILTIAAVKLGAASAIGIEIDAEANDVAHRNAQRNGVSTRVEFLEGDASALAPLLGPVDLVVSNILRSTNTLLLPAIRRALRPGGVVIFSGMEQSEAEEFRRSLGDSGFAAFQEILDAGWWGVAAVRPE
ncbi:MAG TPA: 50S ribosomal protein L11 methyltransferase, partial [Gemmatimonadales bacterium]|nr:50S ribosomal protein L11 methyltransferase [Gemmatimonadales bacterium]